MTLVQEKWLNELGGAVREVYLVRPSTLDVFYATLNGDLEAGMEIHWHNQRNDDA